MESMHAKTFSAAQPTIFRPRPQLFPVAPRLQPLWNRSCVGACGLNELATPELYKTTQPPGKLVKRYRKHSMDTCGARRAPLFARPQPRRRWLAPLKVLSLLFLTAPISAWASDLQPQNIEPRARPFNGSRTSGGKLCSY